MKTWSTAFATSTARLAVCLLGLFAAGGCNGGQAVNAPGTTASLTTTNTVVIASWTTGNALERRALDENGNFAVDQWPYAQALGQQWRLVPMSDGSSMLMNLASGKALMATGAGSALQEADVSPSATLHWKVAFQSGGRLAKITHVQTGLCLDGGANATVGTTAQAATCDSGSGQTWAVQAVTSAPVSKSVFLLVDSTSGSLLRVSSGGNLELGQAQTTRNEQWNITNNDDGTVSVTNLATNLSLQGLDGQDSLAPAAASPAQSGQTWRLSAASGSLFELVAAGDGTCMVPTGAGAVTEGGCTRGGGWLLKATGAYTADDSSASRTSNANTATPNNVVSPTPTPTPTNVQLPWDATGPTIDDILQGSANDCWVLAALSTVVWTDPNYIKNHVAINADGTYTVTIYDGSGNPWTHTTGVIASGATYTPTPTLTLAVQRTGSNGQLIFWPSLYEQAFLAYAEANPGVFNTVDDQYLDTGAEVTGYQYITGQNWYYIEYQASDSTSADTFWTNLSYANNAVPVAVLTQTPSGSSDMFSDGVIGGHFYAVLGTSGTGASRTVTVRNPWGSRAPNVSDATNLGDGEITMNYTTFLNYFYEVQRAESTSGPP